jgi:hypothetical protein
MTPASGYVSLRQLTEKHSLAAVLSPNLPI